MDLLTEYESRLTCFLAIPENEDAVFNRQTYDRKLIQILRDANKDFKVYKCPVTDLRLKHLRLNRENKPQITAQNATLKSINDEKLPRRKKPILPNDDILLMEEILKTLHPTTFASIANTLISKQYYIYPEMAASIVDAAMARPELATMYADLVFNIQRTTLNSHFAKRVAKKAQENLRFRLMKTEIKLIDVKVIYHAISIVVELYRLHIIKNSDINELCINVACKWAPRLNVNEKVDLSLWNKLMIKIGIKFITAIGRYYRDSKDPTTFLLEHYILYLTNLKPSVPAYLEKKINRLEELAARNFIREAPF